MEVIVEPWSLRRDAVPASGTIIFLDSITGETPVLLMGLRTALRGSQSAPLQFLLSFFLARFFFVALLFAGRFFGSGLSGFRFRRLVFSGLFQQFRVEVRAGPAVRIGELVHLLDVRLRRISGRLRLRWSWIVVMLFGWTGIGSQRIEVNAAAQVVRKLGELSVKPAGDLRRFRELARSQGYEGYYDDETDFPHGYLKHDTVLHRLL